MTVDAAGDVFVAGATYSVATPLVHHFVAMKWDSSGTLQWATYESGSNEAYPLDIGIDGGGNVYLAGRNKVSASGYDDFLTIKYAADGTLLWTRSYGGINDERASALAVADDGTVYVAGQADNVLTTLAYDADGTLQWTASESAWSASFARGAALDAAGNLLVTAALERPFVGPDTWLTVKYSGAGVRQWVNTPASALGGWPASLAVTPAGDVVVGGASTGSSTDLRAIRYAGATGAQLWSRSEPPLGHGSDTPCDFDPNSLPSTTSTKCLAVDAAGNSYLAGRSANGANDDFRTLKYDPAGNLQWARAFDSGGDDRAYALALDGAGNVYVTGGSQGDYRTLKYAPDGSLVWSASYDGGGDDRAYAVVADGAGGAYVTGQAGSGAVTVAYDAAGGQRWVAPLGTGSGVALARGPGGTLLVAATVRPSSYKVIVTAKYDAAGSQLWQRTAGSLESSYARDLAVDQAGNVYVAGGSDDYFDEVEYLDFRVLKYDAAGDLRWSHLWGGFVTDESAAALALDGAGAVYVTGISYRPGATLPAWQTLKYDADGALQWATAWSSGGNDRALAVAHDGGGGVYVAGSSGNPAGTRDVRVARYDAATGAQQWAETWDGGSLDTGLALVLRAGSLHVAAASNGSGHDFLLLRYGNDRTAPSAPSSLASPSHPLGGWGSATTLAARWSGAADEPGGSGLAGYSIVFDQVPDTTPDTSVDVPQAADPQQAASGPLAEGQWHVHVRACDHAGNCSAAVHAGPFGIDATPPLPATALASPSHQVGVASDDPTVDVTWTPGSDALSGLVGQAHVFDFLPVWSCSTAPALRAGTSAASSLPLPAGSWYLHVCSRDRAGNASPVATLGPFVINPVADLALAQSDAPDPAPLRGLVSYTLDVTNLGPSDAPAVGLTAALSAPLLVEDVTPGAPTCTLGSGTVTCALGELPAGKSARVVVRARSDSAATVTSAAAVSLGPGALDPQPANDQSTESTRFQLFEGDLDGDGQADLLWRHAPSGQHWAWLMDGAVLRRAEALSPATGSGPAWQLSGADDFDGDGRLDLVFRDSDTGALEFWLMNGTTRLGDPVPLGGAAPPPAHWRLAATGDIDHDGRPDLLWRDTATQTLLAWLMNGTSKHGELAPVPAGAPDASWEIVGLTDCDGDGNLDLTWHNRVSGRVAQWLMDASFRKVLGRFTSPPGTGDASWQALVAADYGGGAPLAPDLVWRHALSGRVVVWYLDRAGLRTGSLFASPPAPPEPAVDWLLVGPR